MDRPLDLLGHTVFITGAANGMGRAISLGIAKAGGNVFLAGRDLAALERVAQEARQYGIEAHALACDVTDEASVRLAVAAAVDANAKGALGLVNVAGGTGPSGKTLWEHELHEVRSIYDVNLIGPFLTMKQFLPVMIERGCGSVVNIGGTFGHKGAAEASAYASTKWALRGLSKSAALEAGPAGIRINIVSPGAVDGARLERQFAEAAAREGMTPESVYQRFTVQTALGRASKDTDVANAVIFLLSDAARNITGQDLLVDGGTIV
jgi:NAD(P)-dependent dehydrogenase (short-subunit alcohol dehydrogenase family)